MSEPTVRKDGRCRVCKGERKLSPQRGVPLGAYEDDPFCSSTCARKFYGTLAPPLPTGRQPKKYVTEYRRAGRPPKYVQQPTREEP